MKLNPINTDTEGKIESVRINRVSVLSELNLEKMSFDLSKGTKP